MRKRWANNNISYTKNESWANAVRDGAVEIEDTYMC